MDTTVLQQKLAQITHLTSGQQDSAERLLFQLAFNKFHYIQFVGGSGSGKSTLALALAELFSEQFNVALLTAPADIDSAGQQLMTQWFAAPYNSQLPLLQQLDSQSSDLLLLLDDTDAISTELLSQLLALPCLIIGLGKHSSEQAELNLSILQINQADAELLLASQSLSALAVLERLTASKGNLHLLLAPQVVVSEVIANPSLSKSHRLSQFSAVIAIALLLLVGIVWWFMSDSQTELPQQQRITLAAPDTEPEKVLPVIAEPESAPEPEPVIEEPVIEVLDEESIEPLPEMQPESVISAPELNVDTELAPEPVVEAAIPVSASTMYRFDEAALLALSGSSQLLQVAVLSGNTALQRFKQSYPELNVLCYERNWQGTRQIVLLLAQDDRSLRQQRQALPADVLVSGPFGKSIKAAQQEIRAFQQQTATSND